MNTPEVKICTQQNSEEPIVIIRLRRYQAEEMLAVLERADDPEYEPIAITQLLGDALYA